MKMHITYDYQNIKTLSHKIIEISQLLFYLNEVTTKNNSMKENGEYFLKIYIF